MYTVMIVDDEPVVRFAIKSMIDWDKYDLEVVASAFDGEHAYKLYDEHKPDIIITDLIMPNMDGLELIKKIKSDNEHTKILVISNYGEYEYVREALVCGASDYMMKIDMNAQTIVEQLQRITDELHKDREKSNFEKQSKLQMSKRKEQIKRLVLKDFFLNRDYPYQSLLDNHDIDLDYKDEPIILIYVRYSAGENNQNVVMTMIEESSPQEFAKREVILDEKNEIVFLQKASLFKNSWELSNYLEKISDLIGFYLSTKPNIVYTYEIKGYLEAREMFFRCKESFGLEFYNNEPFIKPVSTQPAKEFSKYKYRDMAHDMLECIEKSELDTAVNKIKALIDYAKDAFVHPKIILHFFTRFTEYITIYLEQLNIHVAELIAESYNQISNCNTANELVAIIDKNIKIFASTQGFDSPKYPKAIVQALIYINKNYNGKISLDDISQTVGLNKSYLCRIFKEQTSESINNYINRIRMEKASELLSSSDYYIKEVANLVGFDDTFYFDRVFKKYFGISPTKYKNKANDKK